MSAAATHNASRSYRDMLRKAGPFWEAEAEDQDYLQHYPDGKNQFSP
jgi:peptide methionine sulfoxide reductase MsrA